MRVQVGIVGAVGFFVAGANVFVTVPGPPSPPRPLSLSLSLLVCMCVGVFVTPLSPCCGALTPSLPPSLRRTAYQY
jgi:hypothetical protein